MSSHQPVMLSLSSASHIQRQFVSLISGYLKPWQPFLLASWHLDFQLHASISFCFLSHGKSVVTVCLCHLLPVTHGSSSSLCVGCFKNFLCISLPSFQGEILSDGESEHVFSLAYLWGGADFLPCGINGLV